jgi:hypothetical protein
MTLPEGYTPRLGCRFGLHLGPWSAPYLVRVTSSTVVRGEFPRESSETVGEEQRQDRTCLHCGVVSTRRLR